MYAKCGLARRQTVSKWRSSLLLAVAAVGAGAARHDQNGYARCDKDGFVGQTGDCGEPIGAKLICGTRPVIRSCISSSYEMPDGSTTRFPRREWRCARSVEATLSTSVTTPMSRSICASAWRVVEQIGSPVTVHVDLRPQRNARPRAVAACDGVRFGSISMESKASAKLDQGERDPATCR